MRRLWLFSLLAACSEDVAPTFEAGLDAGVDAGLVAEVPADASTPEAALPVLSQLVRPAFCASPRADAVHDAFCTSALPAVGDLLAVTKLLGYSAYARGPGYYAPDADSITYDPSVGAALNLNVVLLGLSTALSGQLVSPINPRAILIGADTFIAFQRGVQLVELATRDRDSRGFNFYLLRFTQACNERGCQPGDLFTPSIERDWTRVTLQDDEELKNTVDDCRQCHQRKRDQPTLLMRELEGPWNHFFVHDRDDEAIAHYPEPMGRDLVGDYRAAKGTETYATLPIEIVRGTVGLALQQRVGVQPLLFPGGKILNERWPYQASGWLDTPQRSATWDSAYAAFQRGEQLALPHYQTRPTDAAKQARLTDAYRRYREGTLPASELPDLRDIFPDDPTLRAEIGLQTTPDAPPAQLLIEACASCHNDVLDQTISRARFNVGRLTPEERELAIERMLRTDLGVMPPREARQLGAGAREALITFLRTQQDDPSLQHAAALGMATESEPPRSPL